MPYIFRVNLDKDSTSTANSDDSLLRLLSSMTMPIDVVDNIIVVLKESIISYAASIGNTSCDVIEHIDSSKSMAKSVSEQQITYDKLQMAIKSLEAVQNYRKTLIAAGVK